jgi:hypothetical protein
MYEGFYSVFVGFLSITVSFFRKNNKSEGSPFIRRYNKQLLAIFGIAMLVHGTYVFIKANKAKPENHPNQELERTVKTPAE